MATEGWPALSVVHLDGLPLVIIENNPKRQNPQLIEIAVQVRVASDLKYMRGVLFRPSKYRSSPCARVIDSRHHPGLQIAADQPQHPRTRLSSTLRTTRAPRHAWCTNKTGCLSGIPQGGFELG